MFLSLPPFDHRFVDLLRQITRSTPDENKRAMRAVICFSFSHDSSWNMFDLVFGDVGESCLVPGGGGRRPKDGIEVKISHHPAQPLLGLRLSWDLQAEAAKVIKRRCADVWTTEEESGLRLAHDPKVFLLPTSSSHLRSLDDCLCLRGLIFKRLPAQYILCFLRISPVWIVGTILTLLWHIQIKNGCGALTIRHP